MLRSKGRRKRGSLLILLSFLLLGILGPEMEAQLDKKSVAAGFLSKADQDMAEAAGIANAKVWAKRRRALEVAETDALQIAEQEASKKLALEAEKAQRENVERLEREAIKLAEKNAAEKERKARMAAKTVGLANDIATLFKEQYDETPDTIYKNQQLCRADGYCDFNLKGFRVTTWGIGLVDVETTSRRAHSEYREICSAVFSAISGAALDFSAEFVEAAFVKASRQGPMRGDMQGVQIKIGPGLSGDILGCQFLKY